MNADAEHGFRNFNEARSWAKQNLSKTYGNEETGGKGNVRISNSAIDKFLSQSAINKSDDKDVHLAVLRVLPEVLRTSIDVETHPDFLKGEDGKRNVKNGINKDVLVHRCYGAVNIDWKPYRVKITLKENIKTKEATNTHSYEATKIELLAGQHGGVTMTTPSYSNSSITGAKLLENVEMSYKNGGKVLDYMDDNESVLGKDLIGRYKDALEITIRLANHNAHASGFDYSGRDNGIGIVVTPKPNKRITNDGNDHIVEFYYDSTKLRWTDGKPLAGIVQSVKHTFYNGVFKDETGLAEREEINADDEMRFRTSNELDEEFCKRWIEGQTNEDGRHTTQVKNTVNSYKKFGDWVREDTRGRDVSVLDASSGLGVGTEWMRENGINADDESQEAMAERVNELSEKLHTSVRIIMSQEEVDALPYSYSLWKRSRAKAPARAMGTPMRAGYV